MNTIGKFPLYPDYFMEIRNESVEFGCELRVKRSFDDKWFPIIIRDSSRFPNDLSEEQKGTAVLQAIKRFHEIVYRHIYMYIVPNEVQDTPDSLISEKQRLLEIIRSKR